MTNDDNKASSDAKSDHNSVYPNEADNDSSKASLHSTGSQAPVHNMNDEPPQLPPDEEELDNVDNMDDKQLLEMKPKFPYYINPKEFLYHHLTTCPEWEARPML